jgi:hypothetical protein
MIQIFESSNKADAPNPAMTPLFQSACHRRRVGDLRRSAVKIAKLTILENGNTQSL